jgi:hypothetical protein
MGVFGYELLLDSGICKKKAGRYIAFLDEVEVSFV